MYPLREVVLMGCVHLSLHLPAVAVEGFQALPAGFIVVSVLWGGDGAAGPSSDFTKHRTMIQKTRANLAALLPSPTIVYLPHQRCGSSQQIDLLRNGRGRRCLPICPSQDRIIGFSVLELKIIVVSIPLSNCMILTLCSGAHTGS